ncbi:hypothetical protein GE09DRAFT_1220169 [Coniochaeta sp. 2T2.1]|nr:hypothetical protein GE09DRAFT_1220169 [Coniochaeta sp. 2T2.1]
MKASMITLLPLACFAIAAPTAEIDAKSMVGTPELADRGLLSPILNPVLGPILNLAPVPIPDLTALPELGQLSLLVTTVVNTVKAIDDTVAGANGGDITSIVPTLTNQLTGLKTTLSGLQAATSGISGSTLNLNLIAGVTALLARLLNALATLLAQITTLTSLNVPNGALNPVTSLVTQLLNDVTGLLDLNILSPNAA